MPALRKIAGDLEVLPAKFFACGFLELYPALEPEV